MTTKTFQEKLAEILSELENGVAQQVKDRMELKIVYRDANDIHNTALQAITALIDSDLIVPAKPFVGGVVNPITNQVISPPKENMQGAKWAITAYETEMRSILHDTGEKR